MTIEQDVIDWSGTRPAWQQQALCRIAMRQSFSNDDYNQLVEDILQPPAPDPGLALRLERLLNTSAPEPSVRIASIANPEHVNALSSQKPLTFSHNGLTIVYGDNGSGKSGYARLLKRIARSRHPGDAVLSDVFRDENPEEPTADLSVLIGEEEEKILWSNSHAPKHASKLQRMLFYDGLCGNEYISANSDFPYLPFALTVMGDLIKVCDAAQSRIDAQLAENEKTEVVLPVVAENLKDTDIGKYLSQLSGMSSVDKLDELIATLGSADETINELRKREARLHDAHKERHALSQQAAKLEGLREHVEKLHSVLGDEKLLVLQKRYSEFATHLRSAKEFAKFLKSEPVRGVGTPLWKDLWEAARKFSEKHAYPEEPFPAVNPNNRCVLCQEPLSDNGGQFGGSRDRLVRFEKFVKDNTQVCADKARQLCDEQVRGIKILNIMPPEVQNHLNELNEEHAPLVAKIRHLLDEYANARETTLKFSVNNSVMLCGVNPLSVLNALKEAADKARAMTEKLSDPSAVQKMLADTTRERERLELLQKAKSMKSDIVKEVERRKKYDALKDAKKETDTTYITRKVDSLSTDITQTVRNRFAREAGALNIKRVTIEQTPKKGKVLHQPKLANALQDAPLLRVFSEGERSALGLAAFFTEAHLNGSKSALILDDPVTSLDHTHRNLVAERLVNFAESRQVIIFTHDVSFVSDLTLVMRGKRVDIAERWVACSRAQEQKPGECYDDLPWTGKDIPRRFDYLQRELNIIKKEQGAWNPAQYEREVAGWAEKLSATWERIFSREIVGPVLTAGGLQVQPRMVRILAHFGSKDYWDFDASYSRVSIWADRHDKNPENRYTPPNVEQLQAEYDLVKEWFERVKGYTNKGVPQP